MGSPGFVGFGGAATGGTLLFDFTTGSLPGGITFTRASSASYNSSGGLLATAAINAPRFNFVAGVACLLIEPAATNLIASSNNFTAAGWFTTNSAVVTAGAAASPDGTTNASSLTSGTGFGSVNYSMSAGAATYTMSLWAKALSGTPNFAVEVDFAFSDGGINLGTSWVRRAYSHAASGSINPGALNNMAAGTTVNIFGAQFETGAVPSSYIATAGAAATRAADVATFTVPAGVAALIYKFDDNSTQTIAVTPGASHTIPTNLARPNIKTITGAAAGGLAPILSLTKRSGFTASVGG